MPSVKHEYWLTWSNYQFCSSTKDDFVKARISHTLRNSNTLNTDITGTRRLSNDDEVQRIQAFYNKNKLNVLFCRNNVMYCCFVFYYISFLEQFSPLTVFWFQETNRMRDFLS